MKKRTLLILFLFALKQIPAQDTKPADHLIVYINSGWNKEKKVNFFTINPDPGVLSAVDLYNLKSVRELLPDENDPDYTKKKKERFRNINADSIVYNYFETESAALNYILSKKWTLFSALPQIFSEYIASDHTNTFSKTKYIFFKTN